MAKKIEKPKGDYTAFGITFAVLMCAVTVYLGWRAAMLVNPARTESNREQSVTESGRQYLVYRSYRVTDRGADGQANDDKVRYQFVRVPLFGTVGISETLSEITTNGLLPADGAPWMSKVDEQTLFFVRKTGAIDQTDAPWVDVSGNAVRGIDGGLDSLMTGLPSPDGSRIAYRDTILDKTVVEDAAGGIRVYDMNGFRHARPESWSSDGRTLYLMFDAMSEGEDRTWEGGQGVVRLDIESGTLSEVTAVRGLRVRAHDTDATTGLIAAATYQIDGLDSSLPIASALYLINAKEGSWRELDGAKDVAFGRPIFSADGKRVAYTVISQGMSEVWVADVDVGGHERRVVSGTLLDWVPDGSAIIVDRDNEIQLVSLADGAVKSIANRSGRYADADFQGIDFVGVVSKR